MSRWLPIGDWSKMRWITHADELLQKVSCAAESAKPPGASTVMFFSEPSAFLTWYSGPAYLA